MLQSRRIQKIRLHAICLLLLVVLGCGGGGGGGGSGGSKTGNITISGRITFDSVPVTQASGLDYSSTTQKPVRGVVVEAIRVSDSSVLDSSTTDSSGNYTLSVPENTEIKIRVRAQMTRSGSPSWDISVIDNTQGRALYVMDSESFDSGSSSISGKNLNAPSGWGGSSYTSTRVAAPFAILDFIYDALQTILSVDPDVELPELRINWSPNNIPSTDRDYSTGHIVTTHYSFSTGEIYVLGDEDNDTDEYDGHIIVHEFGHYLVHRLGRTDTIGGSHTLSDRLDPRVAFDEGFQNALSAIVLDNATYIDTFGAKQSSSAYMDIEDNDFYSSPKGWYSEGSLQSIIYDLYDGNDEPNIDSISLGFAPLYDVMINDMKTVQSFTTIYSFIDSLKRRYQGNTSVINAINQLLQHEDITTQAVDEWDSTETETNDGGNPDTLPVYTELQQGAPAVKVCTSTDFGTPNKLMNIRYFYFTVNTSGTYTIRAEPEVAQNDPVIALYYRGTVLASKNSGGDGTAETITQELSAGTYVGEVSEVKILNETETGTFCFNMSLN